MTKKFQENTIFSKENFEKYWSDGFIIIKDMLTPEICEYSNSLARIVADENYGQIMHLHREEYLISQSSKKIDNFENLNDKVLFIKRLKQISKHYEELLKNPDITNFLDWLYERQMTGLLTNIFFKEPGSKYSNQEWLPHQDNNYLSNENGLYVTVNVAFNYMSEKNGGLFLYPGSHKLGNLDSEKRQSYRESDGKPGNKVKETDIKNITPVACELNKGDVLFMHGLCVHKSSNNNSNDPRPLLSLGYIPYGEKFDPGFNSKREVKFLN